MKSIAQHIDHLNTGIGKAVSWLSVLLVAIIIVDVTLRYLFSITSSASFELEWHLFAALFLLSAGWALKEDKHVRVDVFYNRLSDKHKAWVNLLGSLLFLIPFCLIGLIEGSQFAYNAFLQNETSPDPGGLPARFIIKSTIPIGFLLLGLQGLSQILKNFYTILRHE